MSEAGAAVQEQPNEKEKKPKKVFYSHRETLRKVKRHIQDYNASVSTSFKIKGIRKDMVDDLYVLAILHYHSNNRDTKIVKFKRKDENGELVEYTTLGITTKLDSLATEHQVTRKTIANNLKVIDGTKVSDYNQKTKELGEASKRLDVAAPEVLTLFKTDCYGLLYLLNPSFLVPLESEEKDEKQVKT